MVEPEASPELLDPRAHFVEEDGGFVLARPEACELHHGLRHVAFGEQELAVHEYRCTTERGIVEVSCVDAAALSEPWERALIGLLAAPDDPSVEPEVSRMSRFLPDDAFSISRAPPSESEDPSAEIVFRNERACRLRATYPMTPEREPRLLRGEIARLKGSFLSIEGARRAVQELPALPDAAPDLTELRRRLVVRRYAGDTLRAVEIEEPEALDAIRVRHGGPVVRYGLHAKATNDDWGRSVTLFVPRDRHALLDAFQLERAVAELESLRELGFEFISEHDPSVGERSELHGVLDNVGRAFSVVVAFVRCGVFVNVTIWDAERDALALARMVAKEIDDELREASCSQSDDTP